MEASDELKKICNDLIERYKNNLKTSGKVASGNLEKTARYKLEFNGRYVEVIFQLADYWKYIENGTRPHFPPMDAIEKWITVKRIVPRGVNSRKVPTTRQLAYMISREISINGTKPTKILQKTINESDDLISSMIDEITKQLEAQINEEIDNTL